MTALLFFYLAVTIQSVCVLFTLGVLPAQQPRIITTVFLCALRIAVHLTGCEMAVLRRFTALPVIITLFLQKATMVLPLPLGLAPPPSVNKLILLCAVFTQM